MLNLQIEADSRSMARWGSLLTISRLLEAEDGHAPMPLPRYVLRLVCLRCERHSLTDATEPQRAMLQPPAGVCRTVGFVPRASPALVGGRRKPRKDAVTTPDAVLGELAEQYLNGRPGCCLCRSAPAVTALVYLSDHAEDGKAQGAILGVCVFCWLAEDMQRNVQQALNADRAKARAGWN